MRASALLQWAKRNNLLVFLAMSLVAGVLLALSAVPATAAVAPAAAAVAVSAAAEEGRAVATAGTSFERRVCRDARSAYLCSSPGERCGRGSCIPPGMIRCDDKGGGATYDCPTDHTCGKGGCIPPGMKICGTPSSRSSHCDAAHSCCRGDNATNSLVSCIPSPSCPRGTVREPEYLRAPYRHAE